MRGKTHNHIYNMITLDESIATYGVVHHPGATALNNILQVAQQYLPCNDLADEFDGGTSKLSRVSVSDLERALVAVYELGRINSRF